MEVERILPTLYEGHAILKRLGITLADLLGKRFVDLGSGASNLVEILESISSIQPYGVDLAYANLSEFERRANYAACRVNQEAGLRAVGKFMEHIRSHPHCYVAARFDHLPFEDDFFVCGVSHYALTHLENSQRRAGLREALRVIRDTLVLFPLEPKESEDRRFIRYVERMYGGEWDIQVDRSELYHRMEFKRRQ